jgi:hypothetical protein
MYGHASFSELPFSAPSDAVIAYSLTCAAGAYVLTGIDANPHTLFIRCDAGSYTLTGIDASPRRIYAYSLTCSRGTYTLTGNAASFDRRYSINRPFTTDFTLASQITTDISLS